MFTSSVSNVIYHKFSHDAAFYTLNGKNVTVMLELLLLFFTCDWNCKSNRYDIYSLNETHSLTSPKSIPFCLL